MKQWDFLVKKNPVHYPSIHKKRGKRLSTTKYKLLSSFPSSSHNVNFISLDLDEVDEVFATVEVLGTLSEKFVEG
jgi:hypothetical protein